MSQPTFAGAVLRRGLWAPTRPGPRQWRYNSIGSCEQQNPLREGLELRGTRRCWPVRGPADRTMWC